MNGSDNSLTPLDEARLKTVKAIWGSTVAGLALSIPLVFICAIFVGHSAIYIPFAIAGSAAVSTLVVCTVGRIGKTRADKLADKVAELEQRLANLEMIDCTSARLAGSSPRQEVQSTMSGHMPDPVRQVRQ